MPWGVRKVDTQLRLHTRAREHQEACFGFPLSCVFQVAALTLRPSGHTAKGILSDRRPVICQRFAGPSYKSSGAK